MATPNTTFKLSESDLAVLGDLAAEMRCSRTEVVRRALGDLKRRRDERRDVARAFIKRLHASVPRGATVMIGLDSEESPFATINGTVKREDILVRGERISSGKDDFVRVFLCDPDHGLELEVGAIQVRTGGWIALLEPFPISVV